LFPKFSKIKKIVIKTITTTTIITTTIISTIIIIIITIKIHLKKNSKIKKKMKKKRKEIKLFRLSMSFLKENLKILLKYYTYFFVKSKYLYYI
jgi:hypothetical protein